MRITEKELTTLSPNVIDHVTRGAPHWVVAGRTPTVPAGLLRGGICLRKVPISDGDVATHCVHTGGHAHHPAKGPPRVSVDSRASARPGGR